MTTYWDYLKEHNFELRKSNESLKEFQQRYIKFLVSKEDFDKVTEFTYDHTGMGLPLQNGRVNTSGMPTTGSVRTSDG